MGHTPSMPKVSQPASATDPRYSTSGVLNNQIKEANRQGLMSTFGGRDGRVMNINKFADTKNNLRDARAMPALEYLGKLYADAAAKSHARGVDNDKTSNHSTASSNAAAYNESVDAVNNYLASYGLDKSALEKAEVNELTKAERIHNYDKRTFHSDNYGARNKDDVKSSVAATGANGNAYNEIEKQIKKQPKPATTGK